MSSEFDPTQYENSDSPISDQSDVHETAKNLFQCAYEISPRLDGDVRVPSAMEQVGEAIASDVRNSGRSWDGRAADVSAVLNRLSRHSDVSAAVAAANQALRGSGLSLSASRVQNWNQATPAPYTVSIWAGNIELGNDGRNRGRR